MHNQEKLVSILETVIGKNPGGLLIDNWAELLAQQISDLIEEEKASLLKEILFEHDSLIEVIHGYDGVTRPTDRTGEEILKERLTSRIKELTENE